MLPNPQFPSNLLKKSVMENFIFCAVPIQIKNREYNERKTEPARWGVQEN